MYGLGGGSHPTQRTRVRAFVRDCDPSVQAIDGIIRCANYALIRRHAATSAGKTCPIDSGTLFVSCASLQNLMALKLLKTIG
jgi:hypothetical protein